MTKNNMVHVISLILTAVIGFDVAFAFAPKTEIRTATQQQRPSCDNLRSVTTGLSSEEEQGVSLSRRRKFLKTFSLAAILPMVIPSVSNAKDLSEEYRQGTAALSDMDTDAPVPREAYKKLPSGVIYADLRSGNKNTNAVVVDVGSKVNMQWVLRKSNGYFVDSSERNNNGVPFIFTVGEKGAAIAGVDEGIRGMKEGGVRRLIIPPKLAFVEGLEDGKPGPLPNGFGPRQQMKRVQLKEDVPGEYIYLEVMVTRVR